MLFRYQINCVTFINDRDKILVHIRRSPEHPAVIDSVHSFHSFRFHDPSNYKVIDREPESNHKLLSQWQFTELTAIKISPKFEDFFKVR
jgi:hypothetical protein